MSETEISMMPLTAEAGHSAAVATPLSRAEMIFMALVAVIAVAAMIFASVIQTPEQALRQLFPVVVQPFGLSRASDMVDTNTWLTVRWDRPLVQSYRTGQVSARVDIVSSLPEHAIVDDADRDTYLEMFKARQLHKVVERATLTFERQGLGWRLASATPEQFDAQARTSAYLERTSNGPLTFVADKGVYTDKTAYSSLRVDENHFGGGLSIALAIVMLLIGTGIGVARNQPLPAFLGLVGAAVFAFGQQFIMPGPAALTGAQAWGIF